MIHNIVAEFDNNGSDNNIQEVFHCSCTFGNRVVVKCDLWRVLSIYIRPLDKPALDSWPAVSQLLPTIVLDTFPPNTTAALGMKLGNTGLAFLR